MTGAQSNSIGTDVRGSDPVARDESGGPVTQISLEVESVFSSNTDEYVASVVGSIHPFLDDVICLGFRFGASAGAISRALSDSRSKPCSS